MNMNVQGKSISNCGLPSSFYFTNFLTPKYTAKEQVFSLPAVLGRCISEIQISSEKTSPLPTPIIFSSSKPRTPTISMKPKLALKKKKCKEPENILQHKEKALKPKIVKKKLKKKNLNHIEKSIPKKEEKDTLMEKNKKIKEFGKTIRKKNLKCKMKRFSPVAPWGIDDKKVIEETRLKREAEILSNLKFQALAKRKPVKIPCVKKITPRHTTQADKNEFINKCAIKIQAHVRGFLTRKAYRNFIENRPIEVSSHMAANPGVSEDFPDEDEEVRTIVKRKEVPEGPIVSILHSDEGINSLYDPFLKAELKNNRNIEQALTAQISWRLKQKLKLKELKQNDIQEMQVIAEKFGNKDAIIDIFQNIIERRYEKLNQFFDDHIESMKFNLMSRELSPNCEQRNLDEFFNAICSKELKQTSSELGEDIEKIWEQIETFEQQNENNSFLQDPQPLPPLTPIYEENMQNSGEIFLDSDHLRLSRDDSIKNESFQEAPIFRFPPSLCYAKIAPRKTVQEYPEEGSPLYSYDEDLDMKEPVPAESKESEVPLIHVLYESSSFTLEHSKALQDYSSIIHTPVSEKNGDLSSLEYELDLKFKEPSKSSNVILNRQIFDRDSPSNPFSVTAEKSLDRSGEDIVAERVVSLLELLIYHQILDDQILLFEDVDFTSRLLDDYLMRLIGDYIHESLRPKIILNSNAGTINTDGTSLLTYIDSLFLSALKNPDEIRRLMIKKMDPIKIIRGIQEGIRFDYNNEIIFEEIEEDLHSDYSQIHNEMLVQVCSQCLISKCFEGFRGGFVFSSDHVLNLRLADMFLIIREDIYKWNEIKAGTIPIRDTLRADGLLDEDKLLTLRNKNLAKVLYLELEENEKMWTNYEFEETQILIDLEKNILNGLFVEIQNILLN